ncbi:MAG: hypothetical protein HDR99_03445 [Bacteroides sp.]|nr:hypothetical protein [Bacteroides sp.]
MKQSHSRLHLIIMMTLILYILGLNSCRTSMPIGEQGGKADVGYLVITSEKKCVNKPVEVNINNGETIFTAKPVKPSQSKSNGKAYQIITGKKSIVVMNGNEIVYQGVIMLYPQETKIINLKQ